MFARIRRWWRNVKLKKSYEARCGWLEMVMREAIAIVESDEVKTHLPEAVERFEYIRTRGVIAVPVIGDLDELILQSSGEPETNDLPPLLIFPMLRGDGSISNVGAYFEDTVGAGAYASRGHTIILNMNTNETSRYMGSALLHEAGHAMAAENEGRILKSPGPWDEKLRMEEELRMWHFDCRLVGFLGGEKFRLETEIAAQRIIPDLAAGIHQIKLGADWPLDLCYGPADNQQAVSGRAALYGVYCQLIALHMYMGPVVAHEYQLALLRHIHQGSMVKQREGILKYSR